MSKEALRLPRSDFFKEPVRDLLSLLYNIPRFEVRGQENLTESPVIFAFFPHCGHPDSPAVRRALLRNLRKRLVFPAAADYWSKDVLKSTVMSLFVRSSLMSRAGAGREAIKESLDRAKDLLNAGFSLVISPEGTRTSLPLEKRVFHTGVAELVIRTGRPVIPVRLYGLEEVMPKGTKFPKLFEGNLDEGFHRWRVLVLIGEPMDFDLEDMMGTRSQKRKKITAQIKKRLLEMDKEQKK